MLDYDYIFQSFLAGNLHPLYKHLYPGLIRYAAGLLGDVLAFMAEDCVQDSILKAYLGRDEMESATQWRSWLFVTIRNRAVDMLRKAGNADLYAEEAKSESQIQEDISLALVEQETLDSIYAAVASLPEIYRSIFELSFEKGMRNAEVAEILSVAEITVKKRKARLIELLRDKLGRPIDENYLILFLASQTLLTIADNECCA